MVMFKAKFKPQGDKASASDAPRRGQQQQQPQPQPEKEKPKAPPIEQERGPQYPVKEPGPGNPPERAG